MIPFANLILSGALVGALACNAALAHGGEDHTHPASTPGAALPTQGLPSGGHASRESARRQADGSVFVPKAAQRQWGLRTQVLQSGPLAATVTLNGLVVVDPAAGGRVQAVQAGTVVAAGAGFPSVGQRVRRGELLAWLEPTPTALERGDRLATRAELSAQVTLAERRAARLAQLEGSVPAKDIEAARIEAQSLKERLQAVSTSLGSRLPLRAPADGVIGVVAVVAGEVVDPKAVLFEVVDPGRLLIEAPAYDLTLAGQMASAEGEAGGRRVAVAPLPAGRQLQGQALPLRFRVTASEAPLSVGQPVRVIVRRQAAGQGIAVPALAVARDGAGRTIVWVHAEPERFEPRVVQQEPLGASAVAVRAGLSTGERVVTQGASLLSQVR
ncbi:MAG: efflux RND transporter periplasmic adaptor subunit [Aquabacterium sp.]|uniref:efflux RND transporter periplasmic adaptor subunit n=1 Tax=Aquabacterium sp. TaxID=1872578 RepID=UPI0035C66D94